MSIVLCQVGTAPPNCRIVCMVVTRHPEPHIRRAVRVLAMVGELHRRGYQRLRVMPFMSPSGTSWRCWIGPDMLFYRNHGAILCEAADNDEMQSTSMIARYTSGDDNRYFVRCRSSRASVRRLRRAFEVILRQRDVISVRN